MRSQATLALHTTDDDRTFYLTAWVVFIVLVGLFQTAPVSAASLVTVANGSGGGMYDVGSAVFVSAYPCENACQDSNGREPSDPSAPRRIFDRWSGDTELLEDPSSASTRFLMPDRAVALAATYKDVPRWLPPTVLSSFPPDHRAVIFMLHGATGCAQCLTTQTQTSGFIDAAAARGFAVVGLDSFDRGDKKWQGTDYTEPSNPAENIDMQRLAAVRRQLIDEGRMLEADPVYLVGISNGGVFASLFNEQAQQDLDFPVDAMAFVISSGSPAETPDQTVPIFFALAENDSAPGETYTLIPAAMRHFDALLSRGIATQLQIARERPIDPSSFWPIEGFDLTDSMAIHQALLSGGIIDEQGWLVENPEFSDWTISLPEDYLDRVTAIGDILAEHFAEHAFHNQFTDQLLTFLENPQTVVDQVPSIAGFTPSSGVPGTRVTISGENFLGIQAVTINGAAAEILDADIDRLAISVPDTATTGPIEVVNAAGVGSSAEAFEVILTPVITSFQPQAGKPGTVVVIRGDNLAGVTAAALNGESADFNLINDLALTISVPLSATTGPITLTNSGGSITTDDDFVVDRSPQLDSFEPASGTPGAVVIIRGSGFVDEPVVRIGGELAQIVYASATQLRAKVPTTAETGPVQVSNTSGTSISATDFTVLHPAPSVTALSPSRGKPGTVVKIEGANLASVNSVTFGGASAAILGQVRATLWAKVPEAATTGPIEVRDPWGAGQSGEDFEVLVPPAVTGFSPDRGPLGTVVRIDGTDFRYVTDVKLGTVAMPFTVVSQTQIDMTVTDANGDVPTYGKISVSTEGGTSRSDSWFVSR